MKPVIPVLAALAIKTRFSTALKVAKRNAGKGQRFFQPGIVGDRH